MKTNSDSPSPTPEEIAAHYSSGYEKDRLNTDCGKLERDRTRELLKRFLPSAPARILDVGGGPGGHACYLATLGYEVHLIDIAPRHVELALEASKSQPETPLASAEVGDARSLTQSPETVDAVLLFGPLYHLTNREDRLQALREAYRVLKMGGILLAVGISRFASALDGIRSGSLKDPRFAEIVKQDLTDGQHRNHTGKPEYFTDTFFHKPDELQHEIASAGFLVLGIYGLEGPAWLARDFSTWWDDPELRERLLEVARSVESEDTVIGMSAHLMVAARK
jgi:ubiquinone/menaquinone biosynthesis C-methylase UbiE